MENASKALIIAGAILLSILIISLGLVIYQQAAGVINSVNLNEQEIAQFNGKLTPYQKENASGAEVNALIQTVIASNQAAYNNQTGAYIGINFPTSSNAAGTTYVTINVSTHATKGGVSYSAAGAALNLANIPSSVTSEATPATSASRVATGKTYKVEFSQSSQGLIDKIKVTAN